MEGKKKLHASPLFLGIVGFLLSTFLPALILFASNTPADISLSLSFLFGIVTFLLCYSLPFFVEFKTEINSRINDLSKHAAIGMPEERFKGWLDCISEYAGSRRWIIAKYISQKLNRDFPNIKGSTLTFYDEQKDRVSSFFGMLIRETKKDYLFSFPYSPKEWFSFFYNETCKNCDGNMCQLGTWILHDKINYPPAHIKTLMECNGINKMRLVTIKRAEFEKEKLCHDRLSDLSREAGIKTIFIEKQLTQREKKFIENININKVDVNIFDDICIIYTEKEKKLDLMLGNSETDQYKDLFSLYN